jgi:hypothetical protein
LFELFLRGVLAGRVLRVETPGGFTYGGPDVSGEPGGDSIVEPEMMKDDL